MKFKKQVLPDAQVEILREALSLLEVALKSIDCRSMDDNLNHKIFDVLTLKAMLNRTELSVKIPKDVLDNFTAINGIDYPIYVNYVVSLRKQYELDNDISRTNFMNSFPSHQEDKGYITWLESIIHDLRMKE